MLILTDEQDRLRAADFADYEARMHRLLRLYYGADNVTLLEGRAPPGPRRALEAYFAGNLSEIDKIPVETAGTMFQREVWAALRQIPASRTLSYGALATYLHRPRAIRAVGLANGANPIAIFVPCHRVIGSNASLTGYGGGIERKRWLLEHEGVRLLERRRAV